MTRILPAKLCGSVEAPPSKSCSHRALICAALSDKPVTLKNLSQCDDVMLTLHCLDALGAHYENGIMSPIDRDALPSMPTLYCGESGSTLRFMLPVVAALGCGACFHMGRRLSERPIEDLCDELCRHGVEIEKCGNTITLSGEIRSGEYTISGSVSSQFISGLLLALPLVGGGSVDIIPPTNSANYIDITTDYLKRSSIYVNRIENRISVHGNYSLESPHRIEGDWSAAAYWLCAAAAAGTNIAITGLSSVSKQGDIAILSVLRDAGVVIGDDLSVTVPSSGLLPLDIDVSSVPDLVPPIAVLCACANGKSRIKSAAALRQKESDRLHALYIMLTSMGIVAEEKADEIIICGGKLSSAALCSYGDHRIAMAAMIAASLADAPSTVDDVLCVAKSYPQFIDDFKSLGGLCL